MSFDRLSTRRSPRHSRFDPFRVTSHTHPHKQLPLTTASNYAHTFTPISLCGQPVANSYLSKRSCIAVSLVRYPRAGILQRNIESTWSPSTSKSRASAIAIDSSVAKSQKKAYRQEHTGAAIKTLTGSSRSRVARPRSTRRNQPVSKPSFVPPLDLPSPSWALPSCSPLASSLLLDAERTPLSTTPHHSTSLLRARF